MPLLISAGSSMREIEELVDGEPVDVLLAWNSASTARPTSPSQIGVGLLLHVEGELVDQALVRLGRRRRCTLVVDGDGVTRSVANRSVPAVTRRLSLSVVVDAVGAVDRRGPR